ncbi:uncharacterized protein L3040_001266 [Drepanopeziza brunnea f. sp. 'multigermtubi']|uniref:uncharacterized protein n=1 Tax=Drepanopeziza brunnea f. sp. 'multigermtubi' TaxID=698441 RepID=UPI00239B4C80|nr:hypothetical protein L3040_001266 [Drepanopeziza brunnea f. sp. 'multigermtubi']
MLLSRSTICSILLPWYLLFSRALGIPPGREIIGFRTVAEDEANYINQNHRPFRDEEFDVAARMFSQLGEGYSLINEPAGWPAEEDEWYCVVEADSAKMDAVTKVWIPESYEEVTWNPEVKEKKDLWAGTEEAISEYLESMVDNPRKALRFSYVQEDPDKLLMVIPSETINDNELDLEAQCWETESSLKEYAGERVEWTNWNILEDPREKSLV